MKNYFNFWQPDEKGFPEKKYNASREIRKAETKEQTIIYNTSKGWLRIQNFRSGHIEVIYYFNLDSENNSPQSGAPVSEYRNNSPQSGAPVSEYRTDSQMVAGETPTKSLSFPSLFTFHSSPPNGAPVSNNPEERPAFITFKRFIIPELHKPSPALKPGGI
jgi:hypothetical protein